MINIMQQNGMGIGKVISVEISLVTVIQFLRA
jgi:hypothetical protein